MYMYIFAAFGITNYNDDQLLDKIYPLFSSLYIKVTFNIKVAFCKQALKHVIKLVPGMAYSCQDCRGQDRPATGRLHLPYHSLQTTTITYHLAAIKKCLSQKYCALSTQVNTRMYRISSSGQNGTRYRISQPDSARSFLAIKFTQGMGTIL